MYGVIDGRGMHGLRCVLDVQSREPGIRNGDDGQIVIDPVFPESRPAPDAAFGRRFGRNRADGESLVEVIPKRDMAHEIRVHSSGRCDLVRWRYLRRLEIDKTVIVPGGGECREGQGNGAFPLNEPRSTGRQGSPFLFQGDFQFRRPGYRSREEVVRHRTGLDLPGYRFHSVKDHGGDVASVGADRDIPGTADVDSEPVPAQGGQGDIPVKLCFGLFHF